MSAVRIKKGDTVKVIAGKDKGKEGKVLSVNAKNHTALVEGVNMVTKHAKPSAANQQKKRFINRTCQSRPHPGGCGGARC